MIDTNSITGEATEPENGPIANGMIARDTEVATVFIPTIDEWFKAAYYDAGSAGYFDYPSGTDIETACTHPGANANTANCNLVVFDFTVVGSYTDSGSPASTFDQGGNALEWTETAPAGSPLARLQRGGTFGNPATDFAASASFSDPASHEAALTGFRVASPVPAAVPSVSPLAITLLWSTLGAVGIWRLRAPAFLGLIALARLNLTATRTRRSTP